MTKKRDQKIRIKRSKVGGGGGGGWREKEGHTFVY